MGIGLRQAGSLRSRKPRVLRGQHPGALTELKQLCAGTNVRVLDGDEAIVEGVRFLGTTLWSDFMLFGGGVKRAAAMVEAERSMRDFSRIRVGELRKNYLPLPIPRRYSRYRPHGSSLGWLNRFRVRPW